MCGRTESRNKMVHLIRIASSASSLLTYFFLSATALVLFACSEKRVATPEPTATPSFSATAEPSATSSPDYPDRDVERGVEESEAVPEFPWPPPRPSASYTIARDFLVLPNRERPLLTDAATSLDFAFQKAGYGKRSYYSVPGGFAMASQMEQINKDGSAKGPDDRWLLEVAQLRKFSLSSYLTALFTARPGYYRVIVFIVTSHPFSQSSVKITSEEVDQWLSGGLNRLPENIGSREFTPMHQCTALIYEFRRTAGQRAVFVDPSEITGEVHLERAGLLAALRQTR